MRYLFLCIALVVAQGFPSDIRACALPWSDAITLSGQLRRQPEF